MQWYQLALFPIQGGMYSAMCPKNLFGATPRVDSASSQLKFYNCVDEALLDVVIADFEPNAMVRLTSHFLSPIFQ
jgi:hypothetical protein